MIFIKCNSRFEFDDKLKNKLPKMFANLKTQLYEPPYFRDTIDEEVSGYYRLGWMVDFSPDSVINTALRKENILDFAMANEGNVYNSLFNKV